MIKITCLLSLFLLTGAPLAMAIEEPAYTLLEKDNAFELRRYDAQIVAETIVEANLEDAGSKAFSRLFKYISGANQSQQKISMTAPVAQSKASKKISMTAPVSQEQMDSGSWRVSFMMPAEYTLETLPVPENPKVSLREIPERDMAVIRYSGFWSEKNYQTHYLKLQAWLESRNLDKLGEAVWARYNPPFMPWFLRKNEIQIPVKVESISK